MRPGRSKHPEIDLQATGAAFEAHQKLAEAFSQLMAIERDRKDQETDLRRAIEALSIMVDLVDADPACAAANAAGPLKRLQAALHDLSVGASPSMLAKPPGGRSKPNNAISDEVRGLLASAADALIAAGVPRKRAGDIVARRALARGARVAGLSKGITRAAILRWRDDAGVVKSEVFNRAYSRAQHALSALGAPLDQRTAETWLDAVLVASSHWQS